MDIAAHPVRPSLDCELTHLIGPHRWGREAALGVVGMGLFLIGSDAKHRRVCSKKKGRTCGAWVCDWAHASSDRMSAVAVWWVPDARREFTRLSPTTNRCEVPAKALFACISIDSANSISFRGIVRWFSFHHCPLLSPTLSPFLSHPPSLSSTPLTHNCLSCLHATTDPRQHGYRPLSRQPLTLTSSNFCLFVTGRDIRTRRSRPSAGSLRLLSPSSTCCLHHCDF